MKITDGVIIKSKIQELIELLGDNPIAYDFEEVYKCIIDEVSYPYILQDIVADGIMLVKSEKDVSVIWRELRHRILDGIHSIFAVL